DPVVHVHELRGDEPRRQAALFQPGVRQEQEVTIETRQAADPEAQAPADERLEFFLPGRIEVVVADVGGVSDEQVILLLRRRFPQEVGVPNLQPGPRPQLARARGMSRVQLAAQRRPDPPRGKDAAEAGKKGASPDARFEKTEGPRAAPPALLAVADDV